MRKWIFILLLSFSTQGLCTEYEFISLPKEYSFIRPNIRFGVWPGIFVDFLYILNNTPSEQAGNVLSEAEVREVAFNKISQIYPFLKPSSYIDAEQKYLGVENLPYRISYYEVLFDGNSDEPFSLEGKKSIDPYYVIVLMNKSTWIMESMGQDEHWSRKHSRCLYSKIGTVWTRKNCA